MKDKLMVFGASILYMMAIFAIPIAAVTIIAIAGVCS